MHHKFCDESIECNYFNYEWKDNVKLEMEKIFYFDKITGGKEWKKRQSDCLQVFISGGSHITLSRDRVKNIKLYAQQRKKILT